MSRTLIFSGLLVGKSREGDQKKSISETDKTDDSDDDLPVKMLKEKESSSEKLKAMRDNVVKVVIKSTLMPFRWLRSCYRCFYCYEVFKEPKDLKSHQSMHCIEKEIQKTMDNYWEQEVYVDVSNLSCKLCPETITELHQLVDHLVSKHKIKINRNMGIGMNAFKLEDISVKCLICDYRFRTFGHLLVHTNKEHKGWSDILCDMCGQHFRNAKYLQQHVRNEHNNTTVICTHCGAKVISKNKLRTHMQSFHNLTYKCFLCPEQLESHYKRSQHMMLVHKSREVVKCTFCPKTFVFRSTMMRHVRETHLHERTAVCSICGWRSYTQHDLQKHMVKHSSERNFKCPTCTKAFKTKKAMKQHLNNIHQKCKTDDLNNVSEIFN